MYDVVIIGAGVSGCAAARELSRYQLNICVLEKEEDVCCGTSKANSAIVHAGYDAKPGSLMAKLNVEGSRIMKGLAEELDFPFGQNGSLVLCLNEEDKPRLEELYERGLKNGVEQLQILSKAEVIALEPNVSDETVAALYAPTGGIVDPFELNLGLAENAHENGVEFCFDTEVIGFARIENGWAVHTKKSVWNTHYVINAAGLYADALHNMVSQEKLKIIPRRGEYFLLDHGALGHVFRTIFRLPGEYGKGVLIAPTVHGNLLVGPTATDIEDKEGTNTTQEGLDIIRKKAGEQVKDLPLHQVITSFAGLRAHTRADEFIIEEVSDAPGFFDCAGIESPGLTSAPAIGKRLAELICEKERPAKNAAFIPKRTGFLNPKGFKKEERMKWIRQNPAYGNVVCRCEMVTEGEIIEAIRRPLGAKSLDGVKRRVRAGMGRCQSGFCSPKVMEILARELGVSQEVLTKSGGSSKLLTGRTQGGGSHAGV